ncbi:hypothetical protein C4585_00330 [Candidatus Parcubacteria bacterium]|nr:MAG: hypothetical protein C4585_00330 [Candidatus Parcubacteria bacterium]
MELYHVLNRGVEKRNIFLDSQDYARFVHDLYEFNDSAPAVNTRRGTGTTVFELRTRTSARDPLIEVHGWCLMKNHYHLLVSEIVEGGLTKFLRKLNIGYAMYFNEKYKRTGTLFQGRTKKIRIASDAHFLHILHYIHLNPLDFLKGSEDWRSLRIKNAKQALKHLEEYRWSSYLDYCKKKNFPSILTTEFFDDVFGDYEKALAAYVKDIELATIKPFLLE